MKFWIPNLAALAVVIAALGLAGWQLNRAAEKQALLVRHQTGPQLALTEVGPATPRFARVSARGRFDPTRQVLLDNQVRNGASGVHVLTPFEPAGGDAIYLVNRGWWPLPDRGAVPDPLPPVTGDIRISGVLNDPPRVGIQIGEAGPLDPQHWPNLMTYYNHARLGESFGDRLAERVVQLDPDHPAHTTGDVWRLLTFGPRRHRAYAFQWASIAIAVFVIWLVLGIRSRIKTPEKSSDS